MERENSRLKKEVASLAVLHKENERMKRELESVRALQKELETLRATLTESKRLTGTHGWGGTHRQMIDTVGGKVQSFCFSSPPISILCF